MGRALVPSVARRQDLPSEDEIASFTDSDPTGSCPSTLKISPSAALLTPVDARSSLAQADDADVDDNRARAKAGLAGRVFRLGFPVKT